MAKKKKEDLGYGRYRYENFKDTEGGYSKTRYTYESFQNKLKQDEENKRKRRIREQQEEEARKKAEREASQARTKFWQDTYNNAKNSGGEDQSWQVYAAKMMNDTPGALEREKEREQKRQEEIARQNRLFIQSNFGTPTKGPTLKNELTEKYNFGPYRTQQNALQNYLTALKTNKDTKERNYPTMTGLPQHGPVVDQETALKQAEKVQQRKLMEYLEELYQKNRKVTGTSHDIWEANKEDIGGNLSIGSYNRINANRMNDRTNGIFDNGSNPIYMSDAGLDEYINKNYQTAANLKKQAEEYRHAGYAGLFDYVENLKRYNEEIIQHGQRYTPQQQAVANRTLKELEDTYDQRKQEAEDRARGTFEGYKNYSYQYRDTETDKDIIRNQDKKVLYHTLTGEDYDQRTAHMNEAQIAELDQKIEEARNSILNNNQAEYDSMLKEADAYERAAKQAEEEKAVRLKTEGLRRWAGQYESSEYDPTLVEMEDAILNGSTELLTVKVPKGSREDKAYYYMNNIPEADQYGNTFGMDQKEYFALPEWVDEYNRLYKADKENGTNLAGAFLDAVDPYLSSWKNEYDDFRVRNMAENPWLGIPMRIMSYPMNAVNSIPSMINTGMALWNKAAADPNNPVNIINKLTTTTREEQNKDIDTALGGNGTVEYVLNVADSIGDNLTAMGAGGFVTGDVASKAGMTVVQMIMSGEATGHTFLQKLEEKKNPTEAAIYAIGDGIIEWFTERVSLEALLKPNVKAMLGNTKQLMKYFGLASLAEGSEEIAADFLNWGLDYILSLAFDHETELKQQYYDLITSGEGMGEKEAWQQVLKQKFEQIGLSGLAGFISGGVLSVGRAGKVSFQNRQAGSQIQAGGKANALVDIGLQSEEGSLSRMNAEAIKEKTEAGKKASKTQLGKLAQSIMAESRESMDQKTEQARTESITKELMDRGVEEEEAKSLAETIGKALDLGGIEKLSKKERDAIHANQTAVNTLYKYTFDKQTFSDLSNEVRERTKKEAGAIASVSSMFRNPNVKNRINIKPSRNYEAADSDGYRNATGTEVQGRMGIIVYDKDSIRHAKLLNLTATQNKDGQLMYNVEIDGKQQLVDASQIRTKNVGTAAIIESQTNNPGFYNQGYVNAMLLEMNNAKEDVNPGTFLMDAMRIRYAALEQQAMPETQIPADMAQRLYDTASKAYEAYRQNEQEKAKVNKPGEGVVKFKGAAYGTAEFDAALDKANLSEAEKENIRTLASLMKAAGGQDITFVDNDDIIELEKTRKDLGIFQGAESELYGEQSISGILVNIEGIDYTTDLKTGEKKATGKHHFGLALGHEFTHFLQTHTVKGWNEVAKYVMDEQRKALGEKGLNDAIEKYMNDQGLTLEQAIAEFVSDSCESIFNNKDVLDHIQQTNKTVYGQIRDYVKNLISRVRNAMKNSQGSMTAAGQRMMNANLRELAKRFNLAMDEAIGGEVNGETATAAEISRMSRAQLDSAYMDAVENGTEQQQMMFVNEAAERGGYVTEYAYHGTPFFGFTVFDKGRSMNAIFVSYSRELAQIYANDAQVKRISQRAIGSIDSMTDEQLLDVARQYITERAGEKVNSIELNNGKYRISYYDSLDQRNRTMEWDRRTFGQMVQNAVKNTGEMNGVYQLYTRPGRQLVLDAKQEKSNEIKLDGQIAEDMGTDTFSTRMIAKWARENGYDSVRINNVKGFQGIVADYGIFFNEQDVKSADPVTYDENGQVIPVTERFNAQEKDVRFSRAYNEVVERDKNYFENILKYKDTIKISYIDNPARVVTGAKGRIQVNSVLQAVRNNPLVKTVKIGNNDEHYYVNVPDLQINIELPAEGIKHGFSSSTDINTNYMNAMLAQYVPDLLQNAIEVNRGEKYTNTRNNIEHILVGGARMNLNGKFRDFAVRFTVYNQKNNSPILESMEIMADLKGIKEKETKIVSLWEKTPRAHQTSLTMKLSDFIRDVKNDMNDTFPAVTYKKAGMERTKNDFSKYLKFSRAQMDNDYMAAVESGDTARQQELVYEAGRRTGWSIKAYHGTQRGDRVGNEFRPDRATSGPMAYFTDNRGIAENYARDKRDTSIDYDPDYHEEGWEDYDWQFKVKDKNGKYVPVRTLWDRMSYAQKQKFIENAGHITIDDEGEIIYDEDTNDGLGNYDEYTLRDYKGNGIDALVYSWVKAGELLGDEETFIKVLEMAGIKDAKWFNPNESHEKVYDVLLNIQNPYDTSTMYTMDFLEELSDWYYGKQGHSVKEKPEGVTNMWDKKGTTVWNWIQYGWDDMRTGSTGNWTRIPDGVTDFLKYKGYDGIKDTGGKGGGETHTVWIPFSSEQVKSADPITYDNDGNVIPLSERFDESKTDIRWSRAQTDIDPRQRELSEAWQKARDEANALREQVRAMKPEMDAWVNRLSEAMKNGTESEVMAEYKEWEKGYSKLSNDMYEAEQRYKEANRAYDDYIEERDVAEEQAKIKASGLSEADYRRKQAVNEFGYTTDFREAGYLLPNGKMLNFTGEKGKHYGTRGEDHRGIGRIYASRENQGGAAMLAFMRDGNIRVMAETPGIDLITTVEPTREQYEQIRNMARRFAGEHYFNVDLTDERGYTDDSIEYDGRVDPNRVVNDIKSYYKTGVVPTQSTVSQFHYSRWTDSAMDVNLWMKGATASTVLTEDERELLKAYNGLRTSIDLSLKRQLDYKALIRTLEGKDNLTPAQKDDLTAARNKLEIEQAKYDRLENEMFQITNGEGFAAVMYRENMKLKDYIQGKTQDQVKQAIDEMLKLVGQTQEQITKDTEELKKLATHQAVQTMKSFMGKTSLSKMASILRKTYNSSMNKTEIEDRLAEMALKKASGQDITADTELLAQDLLDKMRGVRTDALESLRGQTLVIGQSLADELKAENSSIKELQSRIKGSGVKIVTGVRSNATDANGRQIVDKHSRISEQWKELREQNAALPDVENMAEIDKLHTIIDFIESELRASTGAEQFDVDFDEVAAMVRASVGNITTYLVDDPKARTQINNLMKQIADLSKATEKTAADMEKLYQQMDDVQLAGQKAKGWATVLQRDVSDAIKYYNTTARLAAENERTKVRKALIAQLRSENAQKLVAQEEKFREQMANDKKARELAADNAALRSKISTVSTRMANRIFAETDQKNVPEEAKAMVREVLNMISQHDWAFRRVTYWDKQQVDNVRYRLQKMINYYGRFNPDTDLDWLVVKAADPADNDYTAYDAVVKDLIDIETGLMEYRNAEGQGRISLADRKAALEKVQKALSEIWNVVQARSEMEIAGRKWQVIELAEWMRNEMQKSRFKGERTGFGSRTRNAVSGGVTWGNLTPEYFFKNLKNKAMDMLHKGLKIAEDRSGLEAATAKARLAQIAEETGFNTWDGQEEHKVRTRSGEITMTTEQIMALYATWLRESNQLRPEDTAHLLNGGFVLAQKENKTGLPGREKNDTRPIRISESQLDALGSYLTDAQKEYVNRMVAYMSGELAELGNEASMKMYGIKKFTEKFYFPIKSWGGVLNKRSDAGISSSNENRAAQQGFSKRVKNNAANAIEIGDFTPTAMKHVAGMITYNTVGPAIENLNKVLNQQLVYGEIKYTEDGEVSEDDTYKQNMRAAFANAYGKQAGDYLAKFMKDMNGGVTTERTAFDKLLSMFKKNAVAGSLSVAAQQPLSYIRAAMMINPKYLAAAISPQYWKGSYAEMMKHSGVAVIKEMGKFDMNYGQTMQEWITPEGMESKARKAWNKTTDLITGLPGAMDMMTWTRMWTAVKLEQMAENKGMDYDSDEFMAKVAERFNDLMRQTQVYDSVMTKSQNMRSTHFYAKTLTSFMAEPTLSLNVLADAFQNLKEKGGKAKAIKAVATFLLSAAAQAGAKAFFGAGRTPDKKKNKEENFYNKFLYNLLSEANPFGLIPGYRQIIETLTDGEFKDDTMGMIAKAGDVVDRIWKLATGEIGQKGLYRDLEDSIGQLLQLATDIPAKNIMRDFRAMVNWFSGGTAQGITGDTYAQRPTSQAVLKYQMIDNFMSNDIIGLANKKLGDAGYQTSNKAYYQRIYEAEKAGNQQAAEDMKEYLKLTSKAQDPESEIEKNLKLLAKNDDNLSYSERIKALKEKGVKDTDAASWILSEYKDGKLEKEEAEKLWLEANPGKTEKDAYFKFEQAEWEKETGEDVSDTDWFRLNAAIDSGNSADYQSAAKELKDHGYQEKDITDHVKGQITKKYKEGEWTKQQTEAALKKYMKDMSADDIWWTLDRIDYNKQTGKDAGSGQYYRLYDAIDANKSDKIKDAVQLMLKHGMKQENIKKQLTTKYKQAYLDATGAEKTRLMDALTKAYKAIGLTANEALKIINGWKPKKETKKK